MRIVRVVAGLAVVAGTFGTPAHADQICVGVTVSGVVFVTTGDQCLDSLGRPTFEYDTHLPVGAVDVDIHARLPV